MACFVVPAVEAVVTATAAKALKNKEAQTVNHTENTENNSQVKIPFSRKLRWLTNLLLGGSVLLMFEHIWHGEVIFKFPFLTAAMNPQDTVEMLHEMATAGVTMALLSTAVWLGMLLVAHVIEKRANADEKIEENA